LALRLSATASAAVCAPPSALSWAVGAVVGLNPMAFDAVLIGRREGLHEPFDTLCSALAKELASASRRLPATPVDAPGV